jgi:hypothetical protein
MRDIVRKSQPIFRDDTQATEHKMVTRALLCFALVPPKGSRWYYHMDRATNRKCWYIATPTSTPAAPRTARPSVRAEPVRAARPGKHERSESEQAALYLEFLRWKEQQGAADSRAAAPSQEATRR